MAVFSLLAGGVGDMILSILEPGHDLGYFKPLKGRNPELQTHVHLWCVTAASRDLLATNPYVDALYVHEFDHYHEGRSNEISYGLGARRINHFDRQAVAWERPDWHLDVREQATVEVVADGGPFIAFHPFAGDNIRSWRTNGLEPERIAEALCEAGARVVLLGGDSRRWLRAGEFIELTDRFDYRHPNLLDMRGRGLRPQIQVVSLARGFIGAASAFCCAAESYRVPSLIYTAPLLQPLVQQGLGGVFWKMRQHATSVWYFDRMPSDPAAEAVRFAAERCGDAVQAA